MQLAERQDFHFTGIRSDHIDMYAPFLIPLLLKPLEYSGEIRKFHPEDVLQKCKDLDWQCWIVWSDNTIDAAFVTHINEYPTGFKALTVRLAGGKGMRKWLPEVWTTLKAYARANGCHEMGWIGRHGWHKALENIESGEFDVTHGFTVEV